MARYRVRQTEPTVLTRAFTLDEDPVNPTGPVTVTVNRLDGTAVPALGGTATVNSNIASFTFPGYATLDTFRITWAATLNGTAVSYSDDQLEVCGGFLFTIADARQANKILRDQTKYPTATLRARRIEVEDEAELICDQAFVPRFAREVLDGNGQPWLKLTWPNTRKLRSLSIANSTGLAPVALTADELALVGYGEDGVIRLDAGFLWSPSPWVWGRIFPPSKSNIIVEYEHGQDYPPPDVVRGARLRIKSVAIADDTNIPDRTERIATETSGVVRLASASQDSTGIDEVDAAYSRNYSTRPSFG
jgi:hypothetical protein